MLAWGPTAPVEGEDRRRAHTVPHDDYTRIHLGRVADAHQTAPLSAQADGLRRPRPAARSPSVPCSVWTSDPIPDTPSPALPLVKGKGEAIV